MQTRSRAPVQLSRALGIQSRVIGALVMRELHTRYGRENIGYLWLFAEPLLLASVVAILHWHAKFSYGGGFPPVPFVLSGYCYFIVFRSIVSRAESLIEGNRPLLHHRHVTLLDMLIARALLEGASVIVVFAALMAIACWLHLAMAPARLLVLLISFFYLVWFSFALALNVTALAHMSHAFSRMLHPLLYLSLPLSGAFYTLAWLPPAVRDILQWLPLAHIFEMSRLGLFADFQTPYLRTGYLSFCCMALTYCGLLLLRRTRRQIHVS